jgi:hypothetical protein
VDAARVAPAAIQGLVEISASRRDERIAEILQPMKCANG